MPSDVCSKCGQAAVYPRLSLNREERSKTLVCWECGRPEDRCRCKGNVKLMKYGIEVEAKEAPAPDETEVEEPRSTVVALATQAPAARRTSPLPRPRVKKGGLQKPHLEEFS